MTREPQTKVTTAVVCLIIITLLLFLNSLTLYTSDDYLYRYIFETGYVTEGSNPQPISNLLDIIQSQSQHYLHWNGRFFTHGLIQLMMIFPKSVFNLVNSLFFLVFLGLILKISLRISQKAYQTWQLGLLALFLWWTIPSFGQTLLWLSGSVAYFWASLFYLAYLSFLIHRPDSSWWLVIIALPFAFLVGMTNEPVAPSLLVFSLASLILDWWEKRQVCWYKLTGMVGLGLGLLVLVSSPGAQKRNVGQLDLARILDNLTQIFNYLTDHHLVYLLICLALGIYLRARLTKTQKNHLLSLLLAYLTSVFVLVMVKEEIPNRVFFLATCLLAVLLFSLISLAWTRAVSLKWICPLLLLFACHYGLVFHDVRKSWLEVREQYAILQSHPQQAVTLEYLSYPKTDYNAYHLTHNLGADPAGWFNQWLAVYFGTGPISGTERQSD